MILLTSVLTTQDFIFIPRIELATAIVLLRNKDTNKEIMLDKLIFTTHLDYQVCSGLFELNENTFYGMTVLSNGQIVYKDLVFCTDQIIDQANNEYFDINKGKYIYDKTYNNDFKYLNGI